MRGLKNGLPFSISPTTQNKLETPWSIHVYMYVGMYWLLYLNQQKMSVLDYTKWTDDPMLVAANRQTLVLWGEWEKYHRLLNSTQST